MKFHVKEQEFANPKVSRYPGGISSPWAIIVGDPMAPGWLDHHLTSRREPNNSNIV